jgi:hypothetical protein
MTNALVEAPVTTQPVPEDATFPQLYARFQALNARSMAAADRLNALCDGSAKEKPLSEQINLAIAVSDFQFVNKLGPEIAQIFSGLALQKVDPEKVGDELLKELAELASELVEAVCELVGISTEAVLPAVLIDLERKIDLLMQTVARIENNIGIERGTVIDGVASTV